MNEYVSALAQGHSSGAKRPSTQNMGIFIPQIVEIHDLDLDYFFIDLIYLCN